MSQLQVVRIPALSDNYIWLAHCPETGETAVVDPAVAAPVLEACRARQWTLTHILNTHHHPDHTGANRELRRATGCAIVGARHDAARIPDITAMVSEDMRIKVGNAEAKVFNVSGHTVGHIAYYFPESKALFCGDTLFSLGCGRMFEGDPATFWDSLTKLRALPDDTQVYCAHEYTLANYRFAVSIDPENPALLERGKEIEALRARNLPTVPSTLGVEKRANPFLRADDPDLQRRLNMAGAAPAQVFAEIRRRKDAF